MLSSIAVVHGINPNEESENPKQRLGVVGIDNAGRVYRYAQNASTALTTAQLCVMADITANHEDRAFAAAYAIGTTTVDVSIGATAIAANEYSEGSLVIIDDTGEGYVHEIVSHDSSAGSEDVTFQIKPGLAVAVTTSTTVTLVRNKFRDVVVATGGTQTDIPVGVTPRAVTADYYFWLATGGIHPVLTSGTNTATQGEPVTIGEATDGSVSGRDAVAEPLVGIAPVGVAPTSGEQNPYLLLLDSN